MLFDISAYLENVFQKFNSVGTQVVLFWKLANCPRDNNTDGILFYTKAFW